MARVKRGVIARVRHKKVLKAAKGYEGARSRVYRVAFQAVIKAINNMHIVTAVKRKRQFRQLVDCSIMQQLVKTVYLTVNLDNG